MNICESQKDIHEYVNHNRIKVVLHVTIGQVYRCSYGSSVGDVCFVVIVHGRWIQIV